MLGLMKSMYGGDQPQRSNNRMMGRGRNPGNMAQGMNRTLSMNPTQTMGQRMSPQMPMQGMQGGIGQMMPQMGQMNVGPSQDFLQAKGIAPMQGGMQGGDWRSNMAQMMGGNTGFTGGMQNPRMGGLWRNMFG